MCAALLLILYCKLFCITLAQSSAEAPCNISRRNQTRCLGAVDIALGDGRSDVDGPSQCRIGCELFSHPEINMYLRPANCSFNFCELQHPFRSFEFGSRMCQPRQMCITACGEEPPGCVYSGTCRELTCFEDSKTRRPANFTRLTYAGPRSIVQVNNSKTSDQLVRQFSLDAVLISSDISCGDQSVRTYDPNCEAQSNSTFLSDTTTVEDSPTQCRTACRDELHKDLEIVRMRVPCGNACTSEGDYICKSLSDCQEMCIPDFVIPKGCVYTGSCKSLICLSGIDSKLPADISVTMDSGADARIVSIDNDADPIAIDPPVFISYLNSVQVPNSTVIRDFVTESNSDDSNENEDDENSGESDIEEDTPQNESDDETERDEPTKEETTKWIWLGPIVGLFGALATAIAALGAAYITRRSANAVMVSSKQESFCTD